MVTVIFDETALAQVMHVFVLTENAPPLGTSGVRVVVIIVTYSSKSRWSISSRSSHLADLGPMLPLSGFVYDIWR